MGGRGGSRARLVVLTGAGVSAESGLKTFRDGDGLWEGYAIEDVATPEAWFRNPELVQRFYNERRKAVRIAQPNVAHKILAELESQFQVDIITQNIDDLHERAGSTSVLHLHGEVLKSQSSIDPTAIYEIEGDELRMGEVCEVGSQLRPHVVWFGEPVPMMDQAVHLASQAELFAVIGTSLVVYPAAGLIDCVPSGCPLFLIDPKIPPGLHSSERVKIFQNQATIGVRLFAEFLRNETS
ncbi:MAG: NAD-dependent protein deacylase [Bdellovibrionales bacterium]|nr:NAD-dependent protein deacylase [Bdellovibrionales bacterium]